MSDKLKYLIVGMVIGAILIMGTDFLSQPEPEGETVLEVVKTSNNNLISGYALPDSMSFAGEPVPLHRDDIKERLEREILVNAFWHSNSVIMIKRANKWLPTIDSILLANDVPRDFKYLCVAESGLDNVISPSKAVGFWQFLSGTAKDFGLIVNSEIDQRYDPVLATVAATKYLKQAYGKFGNWTTVAASYNLGMNATRRIIEKQRPDSYYDMLVSEEPSRYLFRVLALKNLLQNPGQFGFEIPEQELYFLPKTKTVEITSTLNDLHEFAEQQGVAYAQLRYLNPWIRGYRLNPQGRTLQVKLPE